MKIWFFSGLFFLILIVLALINWASQGNLRIETSWVAIALAPAVIYLLATGQLSEFSGFGLGFKLKQASGKPFSLKLEGDRIQPALIQTEGKASLSELPGLIEKRIEALSLTLNRQGYYMKEAIEEYLMRLTEFDFFKHVVFTDSKGAFRGLIPARKLQSFMREEIVDLVKIIEEGAIDRLPGLVKASIPENDDKKEALQVMERERLSQLPVVDSEERFVGIVERDKLTSSILLQLVAGL